MQKECDFIKAINETLFRAVGFLFSAIILILSLLNSIELAAAGETAASLDKELKALSEENKLLRARLETKLSLPEIERRAIELGMERSSPGQIIYMDSPEENSP